MGTNKNAIPLTSNVAPFKENDVVKKILDLQNEDGSWGEPNRFYVDKYKGTVWTLLVLAELYANPDHPQVRKACEFILTHSFEPVSGSFSVSFSKKYKTGLPSQVIPCLTGNMVFTMIRLGYFEDERIQQAIDWIVRYQRTDDGTYEVAMNEQYKNLKACFSTHSCIMGVVKSLKALAEITEDKRTDRVNHKIDELVNFMLVHHVYKKSSDPSQIMKPGWKKFGFPLMYQSDVLEIMEILCRLKIKDTRLQDAIALVRSKSIDGVWILENTYNEKLLVPIEEKKKPSRWVSHKAQQVLKFYQ